MWKRRSVFCVCFPWLNIRRIRINPTIIWILTYRNVFSYLNLRVSLQYRVIFYSIPNVLFTLVRQSAFCFHCFFIWTKSIVLSLKAYQNLLINSYKGYKRFKKLQRTVSSPIDYRNKSVSLIQVRYIWLVFWVIFIEIT